MKEIKKVAGYIRVSTDMQVDGYSLEAQESEIQNYSDKSGWELVDVFRDEGVSGKNIKNREGIKALLKFLKPNYIDAVIVYSLSRLGRNNRDTLNIYNEMEEVGCHLIAIKDNIDTRNPQSSAMLGFMSLLSEMERRNINAQTVSGMKQKAKNGEYQGGKPPLGYDLLDSKLVINEQQCECVNKIYHMYLSNMGYKSIADTLNKEGYKTSLGNEFTGNGIKDILKNPIYIGKIIWGAKKLKKLGDKENYVEVSGKHNPIISEEIFNRVQEKMKSNPRSHMKQFNGKNILSGLLKCPHCQEYGMSIQISKDNRTNRLYKYYVCNHYANKKKCSAEGIRKEVIEAEFYSVFEQIMNKPEILNVLLSNKKSIEGKKIINQNEIRSLEKKKQSLNTKFKNAMSRSIDTLVPELIREYQELAAELKNQILDIDNKIKNLESNNKKDTTIKELNVKEIQSVLVKIGTILPLLEKEVQQNLIRKVVEKIEVKEKHISKITFKFEKGLKINISEEEIRSIREGYLIESGTLNRIISKCGFDLFI